MAMAVAVGANLVAMMVIVTSKSNLEQTLLLPQPRLPGPRPQETQHPAPRTTAFLERNRLVIGQTHGACGATKCHSQPYYQSLAALQHLLLP